MSSNETVPVSNPSSSSSNHDVPPPQLLTLSDFFLGPVLGEGLFGKVYYAHRKNIRNANTTTCNNNSTHPSPPYTSNSNSAKTTAAVAADDDNADAGDAVHVVAIKVMDKYDILKRKKVHMVMKECKLLVKFTTLSSPWVVRLHASFEDDHHLFLLQELCNFGSLKDFVEKQKQHDSENLLHHGGGGGGGDDSSAEDDDDHHYALVVQSVGVQLVLALEHIHGQGVVHGDLSANNVMLTSKGTIKIIDFGCAIDLTVDPRMYDTNGSILPRRPIEYVGTSDYVAPEVIRESTSSRGNQNRQRDNDDDDEEYLFAAIDIWSFACLMYFISIGKSPFHAESDHLAFCKINNHVNGTQPLTWPSDVRYRQEVQSLVDQILIENPSFRLGTQDRVITNTSKQYTAIRKHPHFINADFINTSTHFTNHKDTVNMNIGEMVDGASVDLHFFS